MLSTPVSRSCPTREGGDPPYPHDETEGMATPTSNDSEQLLIDEAKHRFARGRYLTQSSKFEESIVEYKAALAIHESIFGRYHNDTAILYFWIGWSFYFQDKPDINEALAAYCTCLRIGRYLSGDLERPNINDTFIAGLLKEQGYRRPHVRQFDQQINKSIEHEKEGDASFVVLVLP